MGAAASASADALEGCFADEATKVPIMTLREKCPTPLLTRFDAAFVGQEEVTRSQAKDLLAAAALASPRALLSGAGAGDHLKKIFNHLDLDESGALDASELLVALLRLGDASLDVDAVNALIRECDANGDGEIQPDEFASLLRAPPAPDAAHLPHLVLNFDVNQTVLMLDSATGSDADAMLATVLANNAWGSVEDGTWTLDPAAVVGPEKPPLNDAAVTYSSFVTASIPITDDVRGCKDARRKLLRGFVGEGAPGHSLAENMDLLRAQLPTRTLLLQSFLHCLRQLKKRRRSFSVTFRTFGKDLGKIADEFNDLCRNAHSERPAASRGRDDVRELSTGKTMKRRDRRIR